MRNLLLGGFVAVCLVAVATPDYAGLGNRIEPRVFGLPFSLMWNALWVGLSFVTLLVYHLTDPSPDHQD